MLPLSGAEGAGEVSILYDALDRHIEEASEQNGRAVIHSLQFSSF